MPLLKITYVLFDTSNNAKHHRNKQAPTTRNVFTERNRTAVQLRIFIDIEQINKAPGGRGGGSNNGHTLWPPPRPGLATAPHLAHSELVKLALNATRCHFYVFPLVGAFAGGLDKSTMLSLQ